MWSLWRWVSTRAVSWFACTPDRRRAHQDAAAAVEEQRGAAGADERGRPAAAGSTSGLPVPSERDLDHAPCSVISTAIMQPTRRLPPVPPARRTTLRWR